MAKDDGRGDSDRLYLGIDVGGTKVQASLVEEAGGIRARERCPTPRDGSPDRTVTAIESAIDDVLKKADLTAADLTAIGIAIPGVVDPDSGRVVVTPNMSLTGVEIGEHGTPHKMQWELYDTICHLPLIIRTPDKSLAGKRIPSLVSATDFMPTWLHLLGQKGPDGMTGKNLWDLVEGKCDKLYDHVFSGFHEYGSVRNEKWNLVFPIVDAATMPDDLPGATRAKRPEGGWSLAEGETLGGHRVAPALGGGGTGLHVMVGAVGRSD